MNSTTLNFFKAFLLSKKSSILNKTAEFRSEQSVSRDPVSDEAEVASNELVNNLSIHMHERERSQLLMIERALGKITDGTYGQCEVCSTLIGEKRLQAAPFATLCIDCKEDQEDPRHRLN